MTIDEAKKLRIQQMIESFKNMRLQAVDNVKKASDTHHAFSIVRTVVNADTTQRDEVETVLFDNYKKDVDNTLDVCKDIIEKQTKAIERIDEVLKLCDDENVASTVLKVLILIGKEIPIETTVKQFEAAEKRRAEAKKADNKEVA